MDYLPNIKYPDAEKGMLQDLAALFRAWHAEAQTKDFGNSCSADDMVFDGFYPFYTLQKKKILFIGREALGIEGRNYLEVLHQAYKENSVGGRHINQHQFHYLMFYIAYGLNNDLADWEDIPPADELSKSFASGQGVSFAFMNISKLSNESTSWDADWKLIDSFVNAFSKCAVNYFNQEISIINPDLIITMNLEGRLKALGKLDVVEYGSKLSKYNLNVEGRKIPLFDTFHFSAPGKSPKNDYYELIRKEAKNI